MTDGELVGVSEGSVGRTALTVGECRNSSYKSGSVGGRGKKMFRSFFQLSPLFHLRVGSSKLPNFQINPLFRNTGQKSRFDRRFFEIKNSMILALQYFWNNLLGHWLLITRVFFQDRNSSFYLGLCSLFPPPSLTRTHSLTLTHALSSLTRSLEINYDSLLYRGQSCELGPQDFLLLFQWPSQCMLRARYDCYWRYASLAPPPPLFQNFMPLLSGWGMVRFFKRMYLKSLLKKILFIH